MINKERLVKLIQDLVRIDSQNPPGNEKKIALFIKELFKKSGLETKLIEFSKNRVNTLTVLKGKDSSKTLLITPHLDTVPLGKNWKYPALGAVIKNSKLYGRGATDCKANLAVGIEVMRSLAEEKTRFNYDLVFLATADEETGSRLGLVPFLEKKIVKPDYALILDADDFKIIIAQKGLIHAKVSIHGKKAHGAYPERGINAIDLALEAIQRIKKLRFQENKHKMLHPPTINIGTIKGGDKVNMVADWCEFEIDIRFLPGDNASKIIDAVKKAIGPITKNFTLTINDVQLPCEINSKHVLASSLKQASLKAVGEYEFKGSEGATVMSFFNRYGIPSVATGFGSSGCAHATDEYVKIDNLFKGYRMLREFLVNFKNILTN